MPKVKKMIKNKKNRMKKFTTEWVSMFKDYKNNIKKEKKTLEKLSPKIIEKIDILNENLLIFIDEFKN